MAVSVKKFKFESKDSLLVQVKDLSADFKHQELVKEIAKLHQKRKSSKNFAYYCREAISSLIYSLKDSQEDKFDSVKKLLAKKMKEFDLKIGTFFCFITDTKPDLVSKKVNIDKLEETLTTTGTELMNLAKEQNRNLNFQMKKPKTFSGHIFLDSFKMVMQILFSNAINFATDHSTVFVAVSCVFELEQLKIKVVNDGPTILDERKACLFTDFEQNPSLFVANRLCEQMGGAVRHETDSGGKTVFEATIQMNQDQRNERLKDLNNETAFICVQDSFLRVSIHD